MTRCNDCNKRHAFRKYDGICKDCHIIRLSRERHDKVCTECASGFLTTGIDKWKTICPSCILAKQIPQTCVL